MAKDWDTLQVRSNIKASLQEIYQHDTKRPENQKFNAYFDNLLSRWVEYHKQLREYGPFIEYKDANDNIVYLYDYRLRKSIDVYINGKKKKLECQGDNTDCCVHIGFCFAVPEVYKVLIDAGFKEPK